MSENKKTIEDIRRLKDDYLLEVFVKSIMEKGDNEYSDFINFLYSGAEILRRMKYCQ